MKDVLAPGISSRDTGDILENERHETEARRPRQDRPLTLEALAAIRDRARDAHPDPPRPAAGRAECRGIEDEPRREAKREAGSERAKEYPDRRRRSRMRRAGVSALQRRIGHGRATFRREARPLDRQVAA